MGEQSLILKFPFSPRGQIIKKRSYTNCDNSGKVSSNYRLRLGAATLAKGKYTFSRIQIEMLPPETLKAQGVKGFARVSWLELGSIHTRLRELVALGWRAYRMRFDIVTYK